jgi:hypothetical protein
MVTTAIHTIHDRNLRGHSKVGWLDSWHTFSLYQHASRNYALSVQGFSCYTPAMLNGGKV